MTEDAEVEGIVSQFNQTSRLEFEKQIAMAAENPPQRNEEPNFNGSQKHRLSTKKDSLPSVDMRSSKAMDILSQLRNQRE